MSGFAKEVAIKGFVAVATGGGLGDGGGEEATNHKVIYNRIGTGTTKEPKPVGYNCECINERKQRRRKKDKRKDKEKAKFRKPLKIR